MFVPKIGIDLGTTYVLVYVPKRGVIINEPSVVAVSSIDKKILAVGKEAKDMLGRTPDTIVAHRPLKDGVIANYRMTEAMPKLTVVVDGVPYEAGLDPYNKLIDRVSRDNRKRVEL